jgi:hypothetical protein
MKLFSAVSDYFWRCFVAPFSSRFKIVNTNELPDTMRPGTLYVIGEPEPWFAALMCPCNCGETIQLSLLESDSPHWSLRTNRRRLPTLQPSINRTAGCRSHFFLRDGRISWTGTAPQALSTKPAAASKGGIQ